MSAIHPTAIVSDQASVDPSAKIGPFSIIEAGVVIGPDNIIESHVRIFAHTTLGRGNRICHGAAIGAEPQDLTFTPEKAKPLVIGDHNHFKENVVISIGVKTEHGTRIGDHNYFMNGSHVGHDCRLGNHNILASNATLGGHCEMANRIFLSGQVAIHQFCRIGSYVMVSGLSGVRQDIPPYCMVNGQYARYSGLNVVGLRRNGIPQEERTAIKKAYRLLFRSGLARKQALEQIKAQASTEAEARIIAFVEASERGLISAE